MSLGNSHVLGPQTSLPWASWGPLRGRLGPRGNFLGGILSHIMLSLATLSREVLETELVPELSKNIFGPRFVHHLQSCAFLSHREPRCGHLSAILWPYVAILSHRLQA